MIQDISPLQFTDPISTDYNHMIQDISPLQFTDPISTDYNPN